MNFAKVLRTPFLQNISGRLLLRIVIKYFFILLGWGKNQYPGKFALTLQQAKFTIVGQAACRDKLKAAPGLQGKQITQYMFCVSSNKGSSGCHGDSGGPFVTKNGKNEWVLRGVVSWGSER